MISNQSEKSSVKNVSSFIVVVSALFILTMATPVNADEVEASFDRMLNPVGTLVQPNPSQQDNHDPLYSLINASLWRAPTYNDDIIASSFDHMLKLVEITQNQPVPYRAKYDPLYEQVNAKLWSAPSGDDIVWTTLVVYVQSGR